MFVYLLKRIAWLFVVLFVMVTFMYISTKFASTFQYARRLPFLDILKNATSSYKDYIVGILTEWDWGTNNKGNDVWELMVKKLPISLKINVIAFFVYVSMGVALGIISAVKKDSFIDHGIAIFTLVFSSVPSFILAFALILVFGYELGWLPPMYPVIAYTFKQRVLGFAIPVMALSIGPIANFTRLVRGELLETFGADYLLLARTKGLNKRQVIFRHALRNSAVAVMPALSSTFILVLSGSFLIEVIYNIQGVANLFMDSLLKPFLDFNYVNIDTNTVVVVSTFYASIALMMSLIADMLYIVVDPRMQIGHKKVSNQ